MERGGDGGAEWLLRNGCWVLLGSIVRSSPEKGVYRNLAGDLVWDSEGEEDERRSKRRDWWSSLVAAMEKGETEKKEGEGEADGGVMVAQLVAGGGSGEDGGWKKNERRERVLRWMATWIIFST
ncbi:hypothetical protein K7X08_005729 [Anisodus acutangulus]|uniref:Uncharacterized protein n=1 Tax=Anisodus acutangulus TaxID=402998 RepID=A0A9Q1LV73_9SOLA|nr:hypothetical protein K7X08_005729 [Anisodus acutangulus]